jgi:hypothetical protein
MASSRQTTLRQYRNSDIDWIVERIGVRLHDLPHYQDTEYAPEILKATLSINVGADLNFVVFVLCDPKTDKVVGGMAATITRGFVSYDKYMWDIFCWIEPEWRALNNVEKLLSAIRDWALARGCKRRNIRITTTSGYKMEKLDKLLEFLGMERIGSLFRYRD